MDAPNKQGVKQDVKQGGAIAPVDVLVSVGGRMVVVRAGQYLPSSAAAPSGEIAGLARNDEPLGQEDITETDPVPSPAPAKPNASPITPHPAPKSKGAKK